MLDLSGIKKIYFIGIGGIGMSAVAGLAAARGFSVCGSDAKSVYDPARGVLDKFKIAYTIGYVEKPAALADADLVVVSSGETDNPELQAARQGNFKIVSYPELLAALAADKRRIVVVGTHGKGSTAAMLGFLLANINNSSFFVGGVLRQYGSNFKAGTGPEFVLEGDEYRSGVDDPAPKFMHYHPDVLLLNNLELDHPDLYPDLEHLKRVFRDLIAKMPVNGLVVYNADDQNVRELVTDIPQHKVGFGFESPDADIKAAYNGSDLPELELADFGCTVEYQGQKSGFLTVFPGKIYAYNFVAAVSVLLVLGYAPEKFLSFTELYQGLKRRFEVIAEGDITVIDDYAHHPTAVLATLNAAREKYPGRRIIAVFEPHTYSRTQATLPELVRAFQPADLVFISEVYPAREQRLSSSITGQDLVAEISKNQNDVFYTPNQETTQAKLHQFAKKGDVIVVMTVGPYKAY